MPCDVIVSALAVMITELVISPAMAAPRTNAPNRSNDGFISTLLIKHLTAHTIGPARQGDRLRTGPDKI